MDSIKLPPEPTADYLLWKKDIILWQKLTDTPKEKMGIALQYVCRNNPKLHEAIVNISPEDVDKEGGINEVIKVLDKLHSFDMKQSTVDSYENFQRLLRKKGQSVAEFILEFDNLVKRNQLDDISFSDDLLAQLLIKKTNLPYLEEKIVKASTIEFSLENVKKT